MAGALLYVAVIGSLLIAILAVLRLWTRLERAGRKRITVAGSTADST